LLHPVVQSVLAGVCWIFLEQSFTAHMPLLMAASEFELGKRHWNSCQQCYLRCTATNTTFVF